MIKAHLKYLSYICRHKWYVLKECCQLGIPWRGLTHDLSKFLPSEWTPYVEYFYGVNGKTMAIENAFDFAWLLHQKRNRHHWQWWILPEDKGGEKVLPMPAVYRLEMICDWIGAGKAGGNNDVKGWYLENRRKMKMHPETRAWVEAQLGVKDE